jgi:F0F1-type ATP synthase beta subunit
MNHQVHVLDVALTDLHCYEYFRDQEGQDVLLFVRQYFSDSHKLVQKCLLIGRIPAMGYQTDTHPADMGMMQNVLQLPRGINYTSSTNYLRTC